MADVSGALVVFAHGRRCHSHDADSHVLHEIERHAVDLVVWHRFGYRRSWCFSDFLRQAAALSAATISDIWQPSIAGEQPVILSLGLSVRFVCSRAAFVFVFVETMKPWPNQSPEPTAVAAAVAIHVASRRWLSFGR
jgi:hypothetical protein